MRYDAGPPRTRSITLARAKNTERSAARRRARAAARAAGQEPEEELAPETLVQEPRPPLFNPPRVREDLRALPGMFRTRRALWIPVIILLVGFVAELALDRRAVPADLEGPVAMYSQFFFYPQALFTFFLAGFLAPRASYLVGLLLGLFNAALWAILIYVFGWQSAALGSVDPFVVASNFLLIGVIYGTLAAAFAAWYRNFLRRMSDRGRARRAELEARERARRRDERRTARRPAG